MMRNTGFRRLTVLLFVLLAGGLVLAGPASAFDQTSKAYYEKHPMSEEKVNKTWGKPASVVPMAGGAKKLYFKMEQNWLTDTGYRFFVVKDGQVLYSGLSQTMEKVKTHKKKADLPISRVDEAYYKKNVVTAQQVVKVYGPPMLTSEFPGGGEVYVYKTKASGQILDYYYRYFIIKNYRVLGSGATDVIGAAGDDKKGVAPEYASELSKIFYEKHKLTGDEVAKTWGEPKAVKTLSPIMEVRFFENPVEAIVDAKYRYFIIESNRVIASGIANTIN